ncbi:Leucine rich repeat protein [Spraguea lophii 42_110]|uniref:Leucine rich repeat protein n=1 Tax=Spraguea lophii (strain 42_110) TaxID=1358809 RepID=S7W8Z9_SPRLO|nr:Leucine rich repeat protein [Spraguea lophii 42_110]
MNFLLLLFLSLMNCRTYTISSKNYDVVQELIPHPYETELFSDIKNNPDFSCKFIVQEHNTTGKIIEIKSLHNFDPETYYNILPKFFCDIDNLKILKLNDLNISTLPIQFEKIKELEELYLKGNKFKEFPKVLFLLPKLKVLYLIDNKIETIPSEIIQMNALENFFISCFETLISINLNLFRLTNLKNLDLSYNKPLFPNNTLTCHSEYSDVPSNPNEAEFNQDSNADLQCETYKCLKFLYLCGNNLRDLPRIFLNFINLEELDLTQNLFEEIPHTLQSFSNLKVLCMSLNHIEKLIIMDGMFNTLMKLHLYGNIIHEISISDNSLQNLEHINLSKNKFSKLDRNIFKILNRVGICIISNNMFTEIEQYPYSDDDSLYLNLYLKDISVLQNIFYYNRIFKLNISCKQQFNGNIDIFEHVPTDSKITYLDLSTCFLTRIPQSIFKFSNLETFIAHRNQIVVLENVFGTNNSLKVIDLSYNQIYTIVGSIFNINTLEKLRLYTNRIVFLPININNMSNMNLQIDLLNNPLQRQMNYVNWESGLIGIEEVNNDVLTNIRYNGERRLEYINLDLNVKNFYDNLNISNKLNLDKIKLCKSFKPEKHTKTKKQVEDMLKYISEYITYKREQKLDFLLNRIDQYYCYDENQFQESSAPREYQKTNSIIDYFEAVVIMMVELLPEQQEFVNDTLVRLLHSLNFKINTTNDNIRCLDGQGEAYIEAYMRLKLNDDCSSAEHKIIEIITNHKFAVLESITTGRDEGEERETFLMWRNILSAELGFEKVPNLHGNMSKIRQLYDKKYILEQFFSKFTFQSIINEINEYLKNEKYGLILYNRLRGYLISIFGEDLDLNNLFEYDEVTEHYIFRIQDEGAYLVLKSMGYLSE